MHSGGGQPCISLSPICLQLSIMIGAFGVLLSGFPALLSWEAYSSGFTDSTVTELFLATGVRYGSDPWSGRRTLKEMSSSPSENCTEEFHEQGEHSVQST